MEHLRTLTERHLNRALLERQLLLARRRLAIPDALERVGGIQAQYAPSSYIGLWSRLDGFERAQLTSALEKRTVVQGTLMRVTIHLVSADDYWPLAVAVRAARRALVLRIHPDRLTPAELKTAAAKLRRRLGKGTMRRAEIDALVGPAGASGVGLWLDMVRVPPSGTWERRRADFYAAAQEWLPAPRITVASATEHLIARYLTGFGPSTANEVANWSGLPVHAVTPLLSAGRLGGLGLHRYRAENGQVLFDLDGAPLPDPDTPAPVRFLPQWDATLLGHARRKGFLAEEHRPLVFSTKTPQSVATFLVGGRVAGTWRLDDGRVQTQPFGRLDPSVRRELGEEADALTAFHA